MSNGFIYVSTLRPHEFFALVRKHRPWFRPIHAATYRSVSVSALESWRAKGPAIERTWPKACRQDSAAAPLAANIN